MMQAEKVSAELRDAYEAVAGREFAALPRSPPSCGVSNDGRRRRRS